jgi:hypothetical protein
VRIWGNFPVSLTSNMLLRNNATVTNPCLGQDGVYHSWLHTGQDFECEGMYLDQASWLGSHNAVASPFKWKLYKGSIPAWSMAKRPLLTMRTPRCLSIVEDITYDAAKLPQIYNLHPCVRFSIVFCILIPWCSPVPRAPTSSYSSMHENPYAVPYEIVNIPHEEVKSTFTDGLDSG